MLPVCVYIQLTFLQYGLLWILGTVEVPHAVLKPGSDVQEVDVGPVDVLFKLLTQDLVIKNGFPFNDFNIMTISQYLGLKMLF